MKKSHAHNTGFSLVELLVVIAVIAILSTMATAGLKNVARSTNLASAAQSLADQMALARQTASARNLPVEIRIYQLPEFDSTSGANMRWRGLQSFLMDGTKATPLGRATLFPSRVVVNSTAASPLFAAMEQTSGPFPGFGTDARPYRTITIRPNGQVETGTSTTLADNQWFLTLHHENDPVVANSLPANFVAVQINPVTGRVGTLRP